MQQQILSAWFIEAMARATHDMWLKGWDERNGGNISFRLLPEDLAPFKADFYPNPRYISLTEPVGPLANRYFIVTGSGKFFRNVILDPADTLAIIQIDEQGQGYYLLWGLVNGGLPTSELAAHFQSHITRMQASQESNRVIMHCHATNLIALSYVLPLNSASFTHELWQMSTECLVVFPEGIGILPWMVPGTDDIGGETAKLMRTHGLVLWPFHGIFGSGATLDEAFGLIDTAEKSAEILVKVLSMGGRKQTIAKVELKALARRFGVTPMPGILD